MSNEYQVTTVLSLALVALIEDLPDDKLTRGQIGMVVYLHRHTQAA